MKCDGCVSAVQNKLQALDGHLRKCFDQLRMKSCAFISLCNLLKERTNITDTRYLAVDEQVTIFLSTVTHDQRNRVVQERFQHSKQIISYYFYRVLQAILQLEPLFLQLASNKTPAHITSDTLRFYPYFKVGKDVHQILKSYMTQLVMKAVCLQHLRENSTL
ncbi:uncharacterized protein LOC110006946 [Amborella trichopoda]|uniref:uncharacterized protein LOC110006946 n=1 Tax=Amborella trichopoda TaxID=13333 RepID=UPI0009C090E1|nr:uncharacterized protein LOC110006946 [Amborella trichopoda]|eukprot:XP_020520761.1 uncharacterized protein LOC110006946 [Amborella trichopoda]